MSTNSDEKQEALAAVDHFFENQLRTAQGKTLVLATPPVRDITTGPVCWLPIQVGDETYYLRLWNIPVADVSTAEDERILRGGITPPQYVLDVNGDCRLSGGPISGEVSIVSSSAATRGRIHFGSSAYDEDAEQCLGVRTGSPQVALDGASEIVWGEDPEAENEIHSTGQGNRSWIATPVGTVYEDEMELLATGVEHRLVYGAALTKEEFDALKLGDRPRGEGVMESCEECRLTPPRGWRNEAGTYYLCPLCYSKKVKK